MRNAPKYVYKLNGIPLNISPEEFALKLLNQISRGLTIEAVTEPEEYDSEPVEMPGGKRLIQKLSFDAMLEELDASNDSIESWLDRFQAGLERKKYTGGRR